MSLKERIEKDYIQAMKNKDEATVSTLRMFKSAIHNTEIQQKKELADADLASLVQSQIKLRQDSIVLFKKGNRPELAQKEEKEVDVLKQYLPEQMGEGDIRAIVKKAIQDVNASSMQDMGKVMGKIMPELKGKTDGSLVSKIVKEELSSK